MKRGLAVLDPAEVTEEEYRQRIDQVRGLAQDAGLDAVVIYGDVSRSDDVAYLTNLMLYWNETALVVPQEGDPVLLTKLSPRVHGWMHRTAVLHEVRSTKDIAAAVAEYSHENAISSLAIVEHDIWPEDILDRLRSAAPDLKLMPWGPVIREHRSLPSAATLELLTSAGSVMRDALQAVADADQLDETTIFSLLDLHGRRGGFADVLVETDTTPDGGLSTRVAAQYRYIWVGASRVWSDSPIRTRLEEAQRAVAAALRAGVRPEELEQVAAAQLEGVDGEVDLTVIDHVDLSTFGDVPESAGFDPLPIRAGSVIAVLLSVTTDGTRAEIGDTYHVTGDGAEALTS